MNSQQEIDSQSLSLSLSKYVLKDYNDLITINDNTIPWITIKYNIFEKKGYNEDSLNLKLKINKQNSGIVRSKKKKCL